MREPHIGYLYPSGGRQGSTFYVTIGGQRLGGVHAVHVSGDGVRATVVEHYKPLRRLEKEQREELMRRFREVRDKRLAELPGGDRGPARAARRRAEEAADRSGGPTTRPSIASLHPLLRNLDGLTLRELEHIRHEFLDVRKKQIDAQMAELVLIEVTIDRKATPGDRELRLAGPTGLTNPMCFQVGALPEVRELEPNDPDAVSVLPPDAPLELPVVVNGQIRPGDVDRFRFRAKRGQRLVVEAQARRLIPYLADAVPGWFQATLALYDSAGKELAYADDYRFNPDPVLLYRIPEDGVYALEIRDALYRGRDDFVYRVAVSERPFVTQAFPLGGRLGAEASTSIVGWNLPATRLTLDTKPGGERIRQTTFRKGASSSNPILYAVDSLPECEEAEPNDAPTEAQAVTPPLIVNGRIGRSGDVDVFRFEGKAGDEVVAEVYARRLNTPLDSMLRLTDASGQVVAWNDDHTDPGMGLLTHHADSYIRARLPKDGAYCVRLSDAQHQGGPAYGYRLRISPPQPDFALRVTPSSLNVRAGLHVPLCVHVLRQDGFAGDVTLTLKDAPAGFRLSGARIPAGRDRLWMTLAAPRDPPEGPTVLQLEGRAEIGGRNVSHPAVAADDQMQAFFFHHLVPAQQWMAAVTGGRGGPGIERIGDERVRIPAGGTVRVRMRAPRGPMQRVLRLELREPPAGVTIQDAGPAPEGLAFTLKADRETATVGLADNLIVEAFIEAGGGPRGRQRMPLGVLPAIPFEIVSRAGPAAATAGERHVP